MRRSVAARGKGSKHPLEKCRQTYMFIEAMTTLRFASSFRVRSLALARVSKGSLRIQSTLKCGRLCSPSKHDGLTGVLKAVYNQRCEFGRSGRWPQHQSRRDDGGK